MFLLFSILLIAQNNPPVAVSDTITVISEDWINIDVLSNDYDPDGDDIRVNKAYSPQHGESEYTDLLVQYRSDYYIGLDSMRYRIKDNGVPPEVSDKVYIYINVLENPNLPIAVNDETETITFEPVNINVIINDSDPNGDLLMILEAYSSEHGSVQIISDSVLQYHSNYFTGMDSIMYRVIEKNTASEYISNWGKVYIQVGENPDIPIAASDTASVLTFQSVEINVLNNDFDPQGETVEIWEVEETSYISFSDSIITYQSIYGFTGISSFQYRIREKNDTTIYSDWTNVLINISSNPDYPQAVNDHITAMAGFPTESHPLENDLNPTNDTLRVTAHPAEHGIVENLSDSTIKYTPYFNFYGIDSIYYNIRGTANNILSTGYIIADVQSNNSYAKLDANNIAAGINSYGYLFGDIDYVSGNGANEHYPSFEAPIGSGIHSIFSSTLWIGGINQLTDSLHFAGERYKQQGDDFWSGPISNTYDESYDLSWRRLWKINLNEINYHILHYQEQGYVPIDVIQNWPGNGDESLGQLNKMAPFFDQNGNDIYEPFEGDYPLIRGSQAIFFVFNDDRYNHTESGGKKLGIEIHGMAYSFQEPADSALWNSVFVHYDIYNRSDTTYSETYLGNFTDFDIGNMSDDFVKCDVQRGAFIGYNGNDYDSDIYNIGTGELETLGYHENLPAQAVVLLGGAYMDEDQIDNPSGACDESINGLNFGNGIVDDERYGLIRFISSKNNNYSATGDPQIASEYYNYLRGIWRDNTPMVYGGDGHIDYGVGPECNFLFPGDSDSCNWGTGRVLPNGGYNQDDHFWTTEEAGNFPDDIRGITISGPFTLKPGDKQEFDLLFAFARNYAKADPIDLLLNRIDDVRQKVVESNIIALPEALGTNQVRFDNDQITVFPNPSKDNILHIKCNLLNEELNYSIFDISGTNVVQGKFDTRYELSLDIGFLQKGLYIIKFHSKNISENIKLIKQ
jgi:hypothetical protein